MDVSLIFTIRNEASSIGILLDSIERQSLTPSEIVIVDAGSSDGTLRLVEEYMKRRTNTILKVSEGASRGKGRNLAIEAAKFDVIAVTDGGCRLDERWLEELVRPLFEGSCDVSVGAYKPFVRSNLDYFTGLLLVPENLKTTSRISSRSLAFRKSVWEAGCHYAEDVAIGEDTQFHLCFIEKGFRVKHSDSAFVYWEMPHSFRELYDKLSKYGDGYWQTFGHKGLRIFILLIGGVYFLSAALFLFALLREFEYVMSILFFVVLFFFALGVRKAFIAKRIGATLYVPPIAFVQNLAFVWGFTVGAIRRLFGRLYS